MVVLLANYRPQNFKLADYYLAFLNFDFFSIEFSRKIMDQLLQTELKREVKYTNGYAVYSRINDSIHGECQVLKGQAGDFVIQKTKMTNNRHEFIKSLQLLAARRNLSHENMVRLLDYSAEE